MTMFRIRGLITPPCGAPSSVGANRPFSITPAVSHARIMSRAGERAELVENEVVIDVVERSVEIGVENPLPFRVFALDDLVDRLDRVMASPARPKPVTLGLEPGLPFGLQCVTHPSLLSAIEDHRDAERTQLPIRLRDEHPSHRPGPPR